MLRDQHPAPRWWAILVWSLAGAAMLSAATMALTGTLDEKVEPGPAFEHGWPWDFGFRYSVEGESRFFWTRMDEFKFWPLLGDLAVLAGAMIFICLVAWFISSRRSRVSLRGAAILMTALCVICGGIAAYEQRAARVRELHDELVKQNCLIWPEHRAPRWLQRLTGSRAACRQWFVRDCQGVRVTWGHEFPTDIDAVDRALGELPPFEEFMFVDACSDADFQQLLEHGHLRRMKQLYVELKPAGGIDLANIGRCQQLELVSLTGDGDFATALEHLADCPNLKALQTVKFTPDCLPALRRMRRLEGLSLVERNSPVELDAIQEAAPQALLMITQ